MDEAGRKAARRRAIISFVAAGVLVIVSVVGLIGVERRHHRWDRPGLERIEDRFGEGADRRGPGGPGWQQGDDDGPRGGGQDARPAVPGPPGREKRQQDGGTQSRPDGSRGGPDDGGSTSSTTTSTSTTTTAPGAGI